MKGGQPQLATKAPVGLWLARGSQPVGMSTGDAAFCVHISHTLSFGPRGIRTARHRRRQGNKSPGATTTTAACGRNRERLPPGSVQKGTAQLQGKCPSAAPFLHLLMEFVGNTALSPSGQARMLHPHHSGFTRWKTSSACAQMQISSGPNVVSLVPAAMPVSTAHATAFA